MPAAGCQAQPRALGPCRVPAGSLPVLPGCRLSQPSLYLKQYPKSAVCVFGVFHTHLKNGTKREPGDQCLVARGVFGNAACLRGSCFSPSPLIPQVLVTLLTPWFADLPSLLMQLLVGLQAKNIPPKRSGVVFILTKIIPGICLLACSANICVSTTEGVTNFMSEVGHLGGFAVTGHFLCKSLFKLKLL